MKAITLNRLEPFYVVTKVGKAYGKLNELELQYKADVIREIARALSIVAEHPRHDL